MASPEGSNKQYWYKQYCPISSNYFMAQSDCVPVGTLHAKDDAAGEEGIIAVRHRAAGTLHNIDGVPCKFRGGGWGTISA